MTDAWAQSVLGWRSNLPEKIRKMSFTTQRNMHIQLTWKVSASCNPCCLDEILCWFEGFDKTCKGGADSLGLEFSLFCDASGLERRGGV